MQGIIEQLIEKAKASGVPIKISIEIGCVCTNKPKEEKPTGILTEAGENINTEENQKITEENN